MTTAIWFFYPTPNHQRVKITTQLKDQDGNWYDANADVILDPPHNLLTTHLWSENDISSKRPTRRGRPRPRGRRSERFSRRAMRS